MAASSISITNAIILLLLFKTANADWTAHLKSLELPEGPLVDRRMRSCGDPRWRAWYIELVHLIREGSMPRRVVVNKHAHTGLADRLVDMMSAFWMAVITQRAFEVTTDGHTPAMEVAYDWPSINISAREVYDRGWEDLRKDQYDWVYVEYAVDKLKSDKEILFSHNTQGATIEMYEQEGYRRMYFNMGIHPETAFGCAMNFLLAPNKATRDMFEQEFKVMEREDILKIGIQVRFGDFALTKGAKNNPEDHFARADKLIQCAEALEHRFREHNQEVVWYLVTDLLEFRIHAKARYGDKLLTSTTLRLEHSSRGQEFGSVGQNIPAHEHASNVGFRAAAGENWLFGMADFHIVSRNSGFGRTAAFRSLRSDNIYMIFPDEGPWEGDANCTDPNGFTRTYDAGMAWAHI